jgi:diamine N-acetyltransferase
MVELKTINENNFDACIDLRLTDEQSDYIASNLFSLAEAFAVTNSGISVPMPYAIYLGGHGLIYHGGIPARGSR